MKNLVLITVDCLRYDAIRSDLTPNIEDLANGLFFESAYSVASWTAPSFIGILTSTYPLMYNGELTVKSPRISIAQVLKQKGYLTAGFTFHPYLSKIYGYNRGFDDYFDDFGALDQEKKYKLANRLQKLGLRFLVFEKLRKRLSYLNYIYYMRYRLKHDFKFYLPGNKVNRRVMDWVDEKKQNPFFIWIHYMDVHFPYLPSGEDCADKEEAIRLNIEREKWFRGSKDVDATDLEKLKDLYMAKVRDVDRYIGELIRSFKERGLYDDTIFVLTADHGEEFFEHGEFHHEFKLYDELIHVPLLMFGNGIKGKKIEKTVSSVDLAPTLIDLLGMKKPKEWVGENMLLKENGIAISEEGQEYRGDSRRDDGGFRMNLTAKKVSLIHGGWKYIYNEHGMDEFYNLIKDPMEGENMIDEEGKMAEKFLEKVGKHLKEISFNGMDGVDVRKTIGKLKHQGRM